MKSPIKKRIFNQGTTKETCEYCKKPMTVARGNVIQYVDEKGKVIKQVKNVNQIAKYHGQCRKDGRKQAHKSEKLAKKLKK